MIYAKLSKVFGNPRFAISVFALSLAVNSLASTSILGGNTTAQVSDSYPNLFAPAGITFAIWGVIYTLLILFCARLLFGPKARAKKQDQVIEHATKYFTLVSILNALWLLAWQYRVLWLSVLIMLAIIAVLLKVVYLLKPQKMSFVDNLLLRVPFSVYLGWITVATIANITTFLVSIGWDGWGVSAEVWTIAVLITGAIIGVASSVLRHDLAYILVFVWAYYGIWLKHTSVDGHASAYSGVMLTLSVLLAVFVAIAAWLAYTSLGKKPTPGKVKR